LQKGKKKSSQPSFKAKFALLEKNENRILCFKQKNMANTILLNSEKNPASFPRWKTNFFLYDVFV
jgi:hypothetical protein